MSGLGDPGTAKPLNLGRFGDRLKTSLAVIGAFAVVGIAGAIGLRAWRNQAPDSRHEIVSPDGHYRIAVEEDWLGFPGQVCVKGVYVLKAGASLDRNDEDNLVYAGACDGLGDIRWVGSHIEGTVNLPAALEGVVAVTLRRYGAEGKVSVNWMSNRH
jgi:hypothetical protein